MKASVAKFCILKFDAILAVAEPGFPVGTLTYYLAIFAEKLHENDKKWTEKGRTRIHRDPLLIGYEEQSMEDKGHPNLCWQFLEKLMVPRTYPAKPQLVQNASCGDNLLLFFFDKGVGNILCIYM